MVLAGAMVLVAACGGPSATPTTAYCADLKRLQDDLRTTQTDAGTTGAPNAYVAAEIRDAGLIYRDAATSRNPVAARQLALTLTLDGQARNAIDPALLSRVEDDTVAAVKTAPNC